MRNSTKLDTAPVKASRSSKNNNQDHGENPDTEGRKEDPSSPSINPDVDDSTASTNSN